MNSGMKVGFVLLVTICFSSGCLERHMLNDSDLQIDSDLKTDSDLQ